MSPTGTTSTAGGNAYSSLAPASPSTDVSKDMFLQLLVAQLQNQDPMAPTDSSQFVTQLAQFQQLETSMNMAQDVSAIRQDLDRMAPSSSGGDSTTGTSGTQG